MLNDTFLVDPHREADGDLQERDTCGPKINLPERIFFIVWRHDLVQQGTPDHILIVLVARVVNVLDDFWRQIVQAGVLKLEEILFGIDVGVFSTMIEVYQVKTGEVGVRYERLRPEIAVHHLDVHKLLKDLCELNRHFPHRISRRDLNLPVNS